MTKIEEMQAKLANLIATAQDYLDKDDEKAEQAVQEVKDYKAKIDKQIELEALSNALKKPENQTKKPTANTVKESANFVRACLKKFAGKPLTEPENALLLPTTETPAGSNGEGYILPEDVQTKINKKIRDFKSFREVCGSMTTTALTGSFVVENLDSLTGLVDFADGTNGTFSNDIKFTQIKFALTEKAAFIQLSNTLMTLTDNNLLEYVAEVFAKKAVITENAMAIAAIKNGKTEKAIADWKELKSSINKDLDPASLFNTVIVTNQDGFDALDSALDTNGRPILVPDVTNPSVKRFAGYEVKVFSNAQLPSTAATKTAEGTAPIFYGNLADGVKFVDLGLTRFAASTEAGFMSNTTIARLIEFLDVVQCDSSDACYIVGKIKVADKIATA